MDIRDYGISNSRNYGITDLRNYGITWNLWKCKKFGFTE